MSFCHLHCHTKYSLLDGMNEPKRLAERAREFGMESCAITDHGNMHGVVEFWKAMQDCGVNPVVGCEAYVAHDMSKKDAEHRATFHLVLLAKNAEGYENLMLLVSEANMSGYYYKPRIDRALLARHSAGLVGLSACLKGEVAQAALSGGVPAAQEMIRNYQRIFGKDDFFIEVQHNGLDEQFRVNDMLREAARAEGAKTVATNDCHFLDREDFQSHEILLCIQTDRRFTEKFKADNAELDDEKKGLHSLSELWFKDEATMLSQFEREEVELSAEIASRCRVEIPMGKHFFPAYPLPEGKTAEGEFERLCREGFERRVREGGIPEDRKEAYAQRLEKEIETIRDMGFPGYFLVVQEFINWAKDRGIPVGPGRGSAAGSLAAYCLRITNLDPIPYSLLFERFLNPERVSLPDIDVDFCERGRERVIRHMAETYGADRVAQLSTFGTMKARGVVRDVGRALGVPLPETDRIAKLVPDKLGITIAEAMEAEPALRDDDPQLKRLLHFAQALEGLSRHASVHAAGLVVSPSPMTDYSPLVLNKKAGGLATQYEAKWIEKIGLVKFDFLGLKTLTVIDDALKNIREMGLEPPDMEKLAPFDDAAVWKMLSEGKTAGVFQVEGDGLTRYLVKMRPECFEDLIAMLALYRPGPLGSGMVDSFIDRKHGREAVDYLGLDGYLKDILAPTYGVIVYQEQVMQVAQSMAGYTLGAADLLRRAMGKKKPEEMAKQKGTFIDGCLAKGISREKAELVFGLMEKFAEYGFNKSHSAAYAQIAYQTAFLKCHHPAAFFAALLSSEADTKKIDWYVRKMREEFGIAMLPPSVAKSRDGFTPDGDDKIYYGLSAIKGIREDAVAEILRVRGDEPFGSMRDFLLRVDVRKISQSNLELLVKSGACDEFRGKLTRHGLLEASKNLLNRIQAAQAEQKKKRKKFESSLQGDLLAGMNVSREKPLAELFPATDTPFGYECDAYADVAEWPQQEILRYEKEAFGFAVSSHPLDVYAAYGGQSLLSIVKSMDAKPDRRKSWTALVHVDDVKRKTAKNGPFMMFSIDDLSFPSGMRGFAWNSELVANGGELAEAFDRLDATHGVCVVTGTLSRRSDDEPWAFFVKGIDFPPEPNFQPLRIGCAFRATNGLGMQGGTPPLRRFPMDVVYPDRSVLEVVPMNGWEIRFPHATRDEWECAVGLQRMDGSEPSEGLVALAAENGKGRKSFEEIEAAVENVSDRLVVRMAKILSSKLEDFSPKALASVHGRIFDGVMEAAGQFRTHDISRDEPVLDGRSVAYSHWENVPANLEHDFENEKAMPSGPEGFMNFFGNVWQAHPFAGGNTRAITVFMLAYAKKRGFGLNLEPFFQNARYLRDALVRANFSDYARGLVEDRSYLRAFFGNVLLGEHNELGEVGNVLDGQRRAIS